MQSLLTNERFDLLSLARVLLVILLFSASLAFAQERVITVELQQGEETRAVIDEELTSVAQRFSGRQDVYVYCVKDYGSERNAYADKQNRVLILSESYRPNRRGLARLLVPVDRIFSVKNRSALIGYVAHEVGHIKLNHVLKEKEYYNLKWRQALQTIQAAESPVADLTVSTYSSFRADFAAYQRNQEFEADAEAARMLIASGYEIDHLFKMLLAVEDDHGNHTEYDSHPCIRERIERLRTAFSRPSTPFSVEGRRR